MENIFAVKESSQFGRYLVAQKNFQMGEKVFSEDPLVISPKINSNFANSASFACIGCYKMIHIKDAVCCEICHWYACCELCSNDLWHKDLECRVFHEHSINPSRHSLEYLYILRTVLCINQSSSIASEILNLASQVELEDQRKVECFDKMAKEAYTFVFDRCAVKVEMGLIQTLVKTYEVNAYGLTQIDSVKYGAIGLFSPSSMVSHSCSPNMDWVFSIPKEGGVENLCLTMYARHEIKTGDVLSVPYTQKCTTMGTVERRQYLAENYNFLCKCERCTDPSELETYFSGVICPCSHVLLPADPLDLSTHWVCTNDKCINIMLYSDVKKIEDRFEDKVNVILQPKFKGRLRSLDNLISVCTTKYFLHPNNNKIMEATFNWLSFVDLNAFLATEKHSDEMFELLSTRAKQCISIWSKVGALYNWVTCEGILSTAIIKYRFKSLSGLSIEKDDYSLEDKIGFLTEIVEHLEVAKKLIDLFTFNIQILPSMYSCIDIKEGYEFWRHQLYCANNEARNRSSNEDDLMTSNQKF